MGKKKLVTVLGGGLVVAALDLASKTLVLRHFSYLETLEITGFFNLTLVGNQGAAFSFLSGTGAYQGLKMTLLALVALLPIVYFFRQAREEDKLALGSLALIVGGAVGNIHDRLRYGAVVDFLDFHFRDAHWPAFNVADVAICVGVALLLVASLKRSQSAGGRRSEPRRGVGK
ncbi:MAG: signal peptidase II [Deltaproteobacteria bacterium]|jgi:signal peptidase II|nr:signal peptidase II [Deltaproteobacteria bacterium]